MTDTETFQKVSYKMTDTETFQKVSYVALEPEPLSWYEWLFGRSETEIEADPAAKDAKFKVTEQIQIQPSIIPSQSFRQTRKWRIKLMHCHLRINRFKNGGVPFRYL
jgi:hypothetical protein